jgi:hypothetical protein
MDMARKKYGLAVLLMVSCLIAGLAPAYAGFTGDIPAIVLKKDPSDGNLLKNIVLEEMTVRVGIAKVGYIDPKDEGIVFVWEVSAEFSSGGFVMGVDPKDDPDHVSGVDPKDSGVTGFAVCEDVVLPVPSEKADILKGKLDGGGKLDYVVTIKLVMIKPDGSRSVLEEVDITGTLQPAEVPA